MRKAPTPSRTKTTTSLEISPQGALHGVLSSCVALPTPKRGVKTGSETPCPGWCLENLGQGVMHAKIGAALSADMRTGGEPSVWHVIRKGDGKRRVKRQPLAYRAGIANG